MFKPSQSSDPPLSITYQALCKQIKIGDVITFSGTDFPSEVIKVATQSIYVHVAIAHSIDSQAPAEKAILIAESHVDRSLPSVGTGKRILGVQFQWLFNRLAQHPGQAWWTPLKIPLAPEKIAALQVWLQTIESQEIPYDFIQAIGVGMSQTKRIKLRNSLDLSALFCSELVTRALQIGGAIDETLNPSQQTAADVMQFPCFREPLLIRVNYVKSTLLRRYREGRPPPAAHSLGRSFSASCRRFLSHSQQPHYLHLRHSTQRQELLAISRLY